MDILTLHPCRLNPHHAWRAAACGQKFRRQKSWRRTHVRKGRRPALRGSVELGSGLDNRALYNDFDIIFGQLSRPS